MLEPVRPDSKFPLLGILWKFLQNINLCYKHLRSSLVQRNILGIFGIWDGVLCIYKEVAESVRPDSKFPLLSEDCLQNINLNHRNL